MAPRFLSSLVLCIRVRFLYSHVEVRVLLERLGWYTVDNLYQATTVANVWALQYINKYIYLWSSYINFVGDSLM